MTSVLHTWGSALTHHPHIHMIVPGGGLSPNGTKWVACKPGFFLHVRVLARLFRRLFLEGLMELHRAGQLTLFGDLDRLAQADHFAHWLAPFRKSEWVVYAKPPFGGPQAVTGMLAQIGITAELDAMPVQNYWPELREDNFDMYLLGWSPGTFDHEHPVRFSFRPLIPRRTGLVELRRLFQRTRR